MGVRDARGQDVKTKIDPRLINTTTMVNNSKKPKVKANSKTANPRIAKDKSKRKSGKSNASPRLMALVRTLHDPCGPAPAPGFYGSADGYMVRHKRVYTATGGSACKHGYFLFDPTFTSQGYLSGNARRSSFFSWGTTDPDFRPPNTIANPFGNDDDPLAPMVNPICVESPHDVFLYQNANKYRIVSACMKVEYVGATVNAGGLIATLNNLDPDVLFAPTDSDADSQGVSINELIARSTSTSRFDTDAFELQWRPNSTSPLHREPYHSLIDVGQRGLQRSTPYGYVRTVNGGVVTNQQITSTAGRPALMGVAWSSLPNNNNDIRIEITINTEYVPKPNSGMPAPQRKMEDTSSTWQDAVAWLDRNRPSWDSVKKATRAGIEMNRLFGGTGLTSNMRRLEL
jgi:hypothetical protein